MVRVHPEADPSIAAQNSGRTDSEEAALADILVADDAAIIRVLVGRMLAAAGHALVAEAATGDEAIAGYDDARPDLALIDINMPSTNGLDAAREIRRRHPQARLLVASVGLTATHRTALDELRAGSIGKPFTQDDLLAAVERTLAA
jgi:two-component system, chemotaxis family, chemotaxis protein CheY